MLARWRNKASDINLGVVVRTCGEGWGGGRQGRALSGLCNKGLLLGLVPLQEVGGFPSPGKFVEWPAYLPP